MRDREKKQSRLKQLLPQQPFIALVSLVIAIFVWWWVKNNESPSKNVKSTEAVCECKCSERVIDEPKKNKGKIEKSNKNN